MPAALTMETASPHAAPIATFSVRLGRRTSLAVALAVWVLFSFSFNAFYLWGGDAARPFSLVQAIFGEASHPDGYQFGLALIETPFYAVGKLVAWLGLGSIGGLPVGPGAIAIAAGLAVVAAAALLLPVLDGLSLPGGATVLLASVFGTSFFFYGSFYTGQTQVWDGLLATIVVVLLFFYFRPHSRSAELAAALGVALGLATAVRFFAGAEAVALVAALAYLRRYRHAAIVAGATAATFGLLYLVPLLMDASIVGGYGSPMKEATFAPGNPFRMLFSVHRGLYTWTPLAFLGTVGYVRLLVIRPRHRRFLGTAGLLGLAVVFSYTLFRAWDGGWGFGQRYYVPLFPLVALGVASLVEWRPRLTQAAAAVCVAWTLFLGIYLPFGLGFGADTGAFTFPSRVLHGHISPRLIAVDLYCNTRFRLLAPRIRSCSNVFDFWREGRHR